MTGIGHITDTQLLAVLDLSARGHAKQVRKYTGLPYIVHPIAVAKMVTSVPHSPVMIAAALAHDTIEDTDVTFSQLYDISPEVAHMVLELTETRGSGNRAQRKAQECVRLATVSVSAKTIKLADLIDNSKDIIAFDAKFAKTYMKEKKALLVSLKGGDETLWTAASNLIRAYYEA